MRSSTSGSRSGLRSRDVLLAAALALIALAAVEGASRMRGFIPGPSNDVNLWSSQRDRANLTGVVALAGSSRMLAGLDLRTLHDRFPSLIFVQLSIASGSPLEVLRSLAEDAAFSGSVLSELSSPPISEIEQRRFPLARYWRRLLDETQATGFRATADEAPALSRWTCPDGVHLDYRDAPGFTAVLADSLIERKVMPTGRTRL